MKSLEDIKKEVGNDVYHDWYRRAQHDLSAHPHFWGHTEARQACIYESIVSQYEEYKRLEGEGQRAAEHASDAPLLWDSG